MIDRRRFSSLHHCRPCHLWAAGVSAFASERMKLGNWRGVFSFDGLVERARKLSSRPLRTHTSSRPTIILNKIDLPSSAADQLQDRIMLSMPMAAHPLSCPLFFHLGKFSRQPVRVRVLGRRFPMDSWAREIVYDDSYFRHALPTVPAHALPEGSGFFAGFRFQESKLGDQSRLDWHKNDWVSFSRRLLFSSHRRALSIWPLCPRHCGGPLPYLIAQEEFPIFTDVYLAPQKGADSNSVTVYALLERSQHHRRLPVRICVETKQC